MKNPLIILVITVLIIGVYLYRPKINQPQQSNSIAPTISTNPLQISEMRKKQYPGSDLVIEQTLADGSNYHQYIASYQSENLKIYGLLTVPTTQKPKDGWPAIIFNHGYIPPEQYRTTERYVAYVDGFATEGYVVFKSDYRGNGSSEGQPLGAYYSNAYTTDVLNALTSVKKYQDINPNKIGMWGHSMGGNITLKSVVISKDIKAAVIWGGVVGTYDDLINNWQRRVSFRPSPSELSLRNRFRANLIAKYGSPQDNPRFWNTIDPYTYLADVTAPIQLHAGGADEEVPLAFSQHLAEAFKKVGKNIEFYSYEGADHNISGPSFNLAMQRSVEFFNKYLKN